MTTEAEAKQGDGQVTMTANYTGGNVVVSDGTLVINTPGGDAFNPSTRRATLRLYRVLENTASRVTRVRWDRLVARRSAPA